VTSLSGIGVSHGIAVGRALVIGPWEIDVSHYRIRPEEVRSELRRFFSARKQAREEILALRQQTAQRLGEKYATIFDAHLLMLDDRKLGRQTMELIGQRHMNAEWALAATVQELIRAFEQVEDQYIRERGGDIHDVHQRLQRILAGQPSHREAQLRLIEDTVVVSRTLHPSDASWLHQPQVVGFVTEEGGRTSHTAIIANALSIPAVLGVERATRMIQEGDQIAVDGFHGVVVAKPTQAELSDLLAERDAMLEMERALEEQAGPVETTDGVGLTVSANIEFPEEMDALTRVGAQGVGLYRSEFLFLSTSPSLPTEEDHVEAYRTIAQKAGGQPIVIRTLDLGGEKYFHRVLEGGEANPVLGLRAVRFCLARPDIFRTQLRGLLRAAAEFRNISIMVPMVSSLDEWRQVKLFVDQVRNEMRQEGIELGLVPLGPMIEVPAAALVVDALARESDFLAIGTNDLVQYTLAVDRGNTAVSHLHQPWHPAVLRLVREIVLAGRREEIPVSLCGEMASDALGALTLLGLGLTRFSCNTGVIPEIRALLRHASEAEARRIVSDAASRACTDEVREALMEGFGPVLQAVLGSEMSEDLRRHGFSGP
jgi:phosphotransferase system enzyme I (PtsI)